MWTPIERVVADQVYLANFFRIWGAVEVLRQVLRASAHKGAILHENDVVGRIEFKHGALRRINAERQCDYEDWRGTGCVILALHIDIREVRRAQAESYIVDSLV